MIVNSTQELGQRLRERRLALALTQDQVAAIAGVNRRVLGELERGKPTVRLGIALEIARVLGLDVDINPRSR